MSALASLLVRDQIVSVRQVEEAISRQVISGGDFETALLEMSAASENVVTSYRAALFGLPPAPRDQVMEVQPEILRALPREIAIRSRLIPLALDGRRLWVASSRPLPRDELDQIGFLLGCEIGVRIACEVRIAAALFRHYGVQPSSRLSRIAEKLDRSPAGELANVAPSTTPSSAPVAKPVPASGEPDGPRTDRFGFALPPSERAPRSNRPRSVTARGVGIARVIGVGGPSPRPPSPAPPPPPEVLPARPSRPPAPTRPGVEAFASAEPEPIADPPLVSLRDAIERLAAATEREAILEVLLGFSRALFEVGVLFVVHEDVAEGKEAFGRGMDDEAVRRLAVPLDASSAFADVRNTGAPRRLRRAGTELDEQVLRSLGRQQARPFVLIPIFVRDRLVLILYGDRGGQHLGLDDIAELLAVVPRVGDAFERLIVERKRRARQTAALHEEPPESRPDVSAAAPAITPSAPRTEPEPDSWERPRGRSAHPSASEALSILGVPRSAPPPPGTSGTTFAKVPSTEEGPDDADVTIEVGEADPEDAAEIEEALALERQASPPTPRPSDRGNVGRYSYVSDRPAARRPSERPSARQPSERPSARQPSERPPARRPSDRPVSKRTDPRREEGPVPEKEVVATPVWNGGPSSRPPPRRRAPNEPEPSVIVDMGGSIEKLVHDLLRCAPDEDGPAISAVLSAGEATLPVLVQHFPGPLWFDRSRPYRKLPRGRDVSAIARALVSFRTTAIPYVTSLIDAADANVRFYALLVATELPPVEFGEAIARRLHDPDPAVRSLAYDILRPLVADASHENTLLKPLRVEARAPRRDVRRRCLSIRALGELRDTASLPMLVGILEDDDTDVVEAAHDALVELTRQDFGSSPRRWVQWAEKNAGRHRVEWLIDALTHADDAIRAAAGEELQRLTQEYRGYHPGLAKKQRETIQKKYFEWWQSEGRARFRR